MRKTCINCGDPLGTRQLLHSDELCDRCRNLQQLGQLGEKKAKTGLLQFVEEIERRNPLAGTGRLTVPGVGPEDAPGGEKS